MQARQLEKLGVPRHLTKAVKWTASEVRKITGMKPLEVRDKIIAIVDDPEQYFDDEHFADIASKTGALGFARSIEDQLAQFVDPMVDE